MSSRDKVLVVVIGLAIGLAFIAVLYLSTANIERDHYKYMSEQDRQFLRHYMSEKYSSASQSAMWPAIPLSLLCGVVLSYALWTIVTKKGRQQTEQRKKKYAQHLNEHAEEIAESKKFLATGCLDFAAVGTCLFPVLIVVAAAVVAAVLFLCGVFSK